MESFQSGLEFWSCNRLLCFNRILSLGRAEIRPGNRAENFSCNQPLSYFCAATKSCTKELR
jgi:hypothetical protein